MENLDSLRQKLDIIDKQMAELFEKRMEIIENVRVYKKQNNFPIYDAKRESSMLDKNSKYIQNGEILPYYEIFLNGVTGASKQYMKDKNLINN